jgi:hypothetical protein
MRRAALHHLSIVLVLLGCGTERAPERRAPTSAADAAPPAAKTCVEQARAEVASCEPAREALEACLYTRAHNAQTMCRGTDRYPGRHAGGRPVEPGDEQACVAGWVASSAPACCEGARTKLAACE